jgi:hypothetical protein
MTPPQQGSEAVNSNIKKESMSYPGPCTGTTMTTYVHSGFRNVHRVSANNMPSYVLTLKLNITYWIAFCSGFKVDSIRYSLSATALEPAHNRASNVRIEVFKYTIAQCITLLFHGSGMRNQVRSWQKQHFPAGTDTMFKMSMHMHGSTGGNRRNAQPNSALSACTDRKAWKQGTAFRSTVSLSDTWVYLSE